MKQLGIFLYLLCISLNINSQKLNLPCHNSNIEFINFISEDSLEFKINYGEGIISTLYGYGKYIERGRKILLKTVRPESQDNSQHHNIRSIDTTSIEINVSWLKEPISSCTVLICDDRKKVVSGSVTDNQGYAKLSNLIFTDETNYKLLIGMVGRDIYDLPLKEVLGKSMNIELCPYRVLNGPEVIFLIKEKKDDRFLIGQYIQKKIINRGLCNKIRGQIYFKFFPRIFGTRL
jgi:hypothetical protein